MLPTVNTDIAWSLEHETNSGEEWIDQQMERLFKINPVIAQLIAEAWEDEAVHNQHGVAYIALLVYRMLEAQSECDELTSA